MEYFEKIKLFVFSQDYYTFIGVLDSVGFEIVDYRMTPFSYSLSIIPVWS